MKHWRLLLAFFAFATAGMLFLRSVANRPQPMTGDQAPLVATSFYPLAYLAGRVAGETLQVQPITPGGVEPHDFEPSPQDILRLQQSKIFIYNGAGLDPWADKMADGLRKQGVIVINITTSLQALGVVLHSGHGEESEEAAPEAPAEGAQVSYDPHVWLDPNYAMLMSDVIAAALADAYPAQRSAFQTRAQNLRQDLAGVDTLYRQQLANCRLQEIIVSHDAFGYMASRYGFTIIPIAGFSPQEQPSAKRLGELTVLAKTKGIKTIFFETLVSPKLSETLAQEVGATTAVLDPIEGTTGPDYIELMNENAQALHGALECQ